MLVRGRKQYVRSQYEWHVKSGPRGSSPLDFEASVTECTAQHHVLYPATNKTHFANRILTMAFIASLLNLVGFVFLAHA